MNALYRVICPQTMTTCYSDNLETANIDLAIMRLQHADAYLEQATFATDFLGNEYVACWTEVE